MGEGHLRVGGRMTKLDAWLRLLRISNLPTVWSNTFAGYVLGLWIMVEAHHDVVMGQGAEVLMRMLEDGWTLLAGFSLIYLGGMAMNDAMDAPVDARERPQRPIPAGDISRRTATIATMMLFLAGLGFFELHRQANHITEPWVLVGGLALIVSVQTYNVLHTHTSWAMVFMAACRGLVTWTAGIAHTGPPDYDILESAFEVFVTLVSLGYYGSDHYAAAVPWALPALAVAIAGYTLLISIVARGEDETGGAGRKRVVVGMIVAMPMVDALAMGVIGQWWIAGFCVACAMVAGAAQRRVLGT